MTLSVFEAARAAPLAEALLCEGERFTFQALAARVQARCAELEGIGLCSERARPVALLVDGSVRMFELLHALIALGIPVLPIHPRLTAPERAHLLQLSAAQTLLDPSQTEPAQPVNVEWRQPPVPDEQALALVPTSGSTGMPKLTVLSRRAFAALARADAQRIAPSPEDRALLCLPLSHVGGLSVVLRCLAARRCCVVFRGSKPSLLESTAELAQTVIDERITLLSLVPTVLARLLREVPNLGQRARLRALLLGGQACSEALFLAAREQGLPVLTSYGLTETCSQASTLAFPPPAQVSARQGVVSVGFPLPGVELRVVQGLIEVRGPTLFSGYVGEPSALAGDGFFHTGDRGELDPEHGLFVFGRASELIITGGENVDPSEVEHALLACGGLGSVFVFGIPDAEFGARVAAVLEPLPGAPFDERSLFAALDLRLASFKQPRAVCIVEALPRLASGKLDRARIREEIAPKLRPADRDGRR